MTITNYGRQQAINAIGSQMNYFAVGAGSTVMNSGLNTLTGSEFLRLQTTSVDFSTPLKCTITSDINSVYLSGLVLRQFGEFGVSGINIGSVYNINQLNGSLVCDGTTELTFEDSLTVS